MSGLPWSSKVLRQQPDLIEPCLTIIEHELPTGVGNVDLYARDIKGSLVVVEFKRGKATHEAVHQLARYALQVKANQPAGTRVRGLLVAPDATGPALKQLAALHLEFRRLTALPELEPVNIGLNQLPVSGNAYSVGRAEL